MRRNDCAYWHVLSLLEFPLGGLLKSNDNRAGLLRQLTQRLISDKVVLARFELRDNSSLMDSR